ncbi:hypothetical protein [Sphingopyxis sp. GW247-27LB]|uniref:hypothetical protein n=1 Tax=Sphingopyxis sp. GW247-27LB TaxID=2012632 RepID=UPI000BA7A05F|nr:hypothetical protein [Sphingopyxis sp. GW247-27LB]PAL19823.1 hypothetical protein CD928_20785 [Sphingopyxis sp. GW247-27LB]
MKRWLSLLLLLGALLGLLGQEAAFADVMPVMKADQTANVPQMSADCAEMMALAKQQTQPEDPCQGMTPDCMAKMGCGVALALLPPLPIALPGEYRASMPPQASTMPLVGRDTGPEPEPPAILG